MRSQELLDTALTAARAAADLHQHHPGAVAVEDWDEKGASDFVTHVDREAEERIIERVRSRFPDHDILAEESAADDDGGADDAGRGSLPDAEWLWIIDPLDGTTNFLHRHPMHAASVAVARRGRVEAGAVVCGATGEEWTATRGGGARKNGRRIRASGIERLEHALIGTGFPFKAHDLLPGYLRQFDRVLRRTSGIRRAGSAALDLCYVAEGRFDGFWELILSPWDIAAGTLILREAGGAVTGLDGESDVLTGETVEVLAGNPAIHNELGALLLDAP